MAENEILAPGKLPAEMLENLLKKYSIYDASIVVGPGIGNDAAVISWGDSFLVAKTDPITFVTSDIGYYAVHVNANDIACLGGTPRWFLVTLLLPEKKTTVERVETIFRQINDVCQQMKITLCGGHTEITTNLDRPIVVGQMLGTVSGEKLVRPGGIQVGDDILVTKGVAIEATSIIAREKFAEIAGLFSEEFAQRCADFIYKPGISVLPEVRLLQEIAPIHALHDPTEGGIATGIHELARASEVKLRIEMDAIPIIPEAKLLCDEYGLDILGVIASGALLFAVSPRFSQEIISHLEKNEILAAVIGKAVSKGTGVELVSDYEKIELPRFHQDEIIKIFK
jgi:hydrogenase maturation factor